MSKCECESRIRILGDGCRYCQPQTYIEAMERCHADDTALLKQALEALEAMNPYPASKEDQRAKAITALLERLGEKA